MLQTHSFFFIITFIFIHLTKLAYIRYHPTIYTWRATEWTLPWKRWTVSISQYRASIKCQTNIFWKRTKLFLDHIKTRLEASGIIALDLYRYLYRTQHSLTFKRMSSIHNLLTKGKKKTNPTFTGPDQILSIHYHPVLSTIYLWHNSETAQHSIYLCALFDRKKYRRL